MHARAIVAFVAFAALLLKTMAANDDFFAILQIFNDMQSTYDTYTNRTYKLPEDAELVSATLKVKSNKNNGNVYDFIVIGAGSSGSVIASRLAENPKWTILLLEAGRIENSLTRIPLISGALQLTDYSWKYLMEYQPDFGKGMKDKRISWPSGKALGGSSVISNMIYSRGNPQDYDRWEGEGNPGWDYNSLLPYFMKSEKCTLSHANYLYHGTQGMVSVEDSYQPRMQKVFVRGGKELGYRPYVDYNSPHQLGFTSMQGTLKRGKRHTVARAYLFPKLRQLNLQVTTEAYVTKILIDPKTKVAYGVEYHKDDVIIKAFAKKEVILSAGVFNSPKLLMLSGVGPKEHLHDLGIPLIRDLPVGENLFDHPAYMGLIFKYTRPLTHTYLDLINPLMIHDFLILGKGPYTSLGGVDGIALIHTNTSSEYPKRPDVELLLISSSTLGLGRGSEYIYRIRNDIYNDYWGKVTGATFSIWPVLLHAKSKGSVRLRNADPLSHPLLYGNYYTDPQNDDIKTMISALRFLVRLSKTKAFKNSGVTLDNTRVPGCTYQMTSDDYWECALRTFTTTLYHYAGSNKMGPHYDPKSVVNHELKVYGIQGLRVADASVIPVTLGAHINAVAVVIGEKASDMIKQFWEGVPEL